ncbi:epididymal secretory protein 4-like [Rhineura floridana]|uniref:epididymal secretory protein 4-like n=1 Tax=Rhineura floridana TaxID=261503 RepID=UPI002AC84C32|nr:epididymal secretory protein 4-like [Rhineura floridana]
MQALLGILGLGLVGTFHLADGIPVQPRFDYQRMEGMWHHIAMVNKGAEPDVVAGVIRIHPMPKGDLSVERNIVVRLACRAVNFRFRHADPPGKFTVFNAKGDQSNIHVVDTNYDGYLVLHTEIGQDTGLHLFARGLEVLDNIKEKFKGHVKSLGFSESDIQYPGKDEQCSMTDKS